MKYVIWGLIILFLAAFVTSFTAQYLFARMMKNEVQQELFRDVQNEQFRTVTGEDLDSLPAPVQRWLRNAGVVDKEIAQTLRLKQKGTLRTEPNESWMPFTAHEYFNFEDPGFIWFSKIQAAPLFHIGGRDKYFEGRGNMLIKVMSLLKVAEGTGEAIDQGSLVRYLAELVWSPSAVLYDYVKWESIDDQSARATMEYQGVMAEGTFYFGEDGNPVRFSAPRFMEAAGGYSMEQWEITVGDYQGYDGILLPSTATVTWKLDKGDFTWLHLELADLEYNETMIYNW